MWADVAPDRLALVTNRERRARRSGPTTSSDGSWRQVTDDPVGVETVHVAPDGRAGVVARCAPATNAATGWRRRSTAARPRRSCAVFPTPGPWASRWCRRPRSRLGLRDRRRLPGVHRRRRPGRAAGLPSRATPPASAPNGPKGVGGLSRTGPCSASGTARTATSCTQRSGSSTPSTGEAVGDLADPGRQAGRRWRGHRAGHTLAFVSELGAFERPGLWDLDSGGAPRSDAARPPGRPPPGGLVSPTRRRCWCATSTRDGRSCCPRRRRRRDHRGRRRSRRRHRRRARSGPDGTVWFQTSDACDPPHDRRPEGTARPRDPGRRPARGRRCADSGSRTRTASPSMPSWRRPTATARSRP